VRREELGRFERLPWRKMILVSLSVAIIAIVAIGAYKTLSLPAEERYTFDRFRVRLEALLREAAS